MPSGVQRFRRRRFAYNLSWRCAGRPGQTGAKNFPRKRQRVKKILFVCTANVCRSPMAQAIFNALTEDEGLHLRAESAGTAALEGEPMAPNTVAALEEAGIYPGVHRARQVSATMMGEAELVLAMGPRHAAALHYLGGNPALGIHTLLGYATGFGGKEVPDPYGLTMIAHRSTLRQIYGYVERVVDRLAG